MSGAIPPLPHYAYIAWRSVKNTGTTFYFACQKRLSGTVYDPVHVELLIIILVVTKLTN
jgi:hypothetical protein